MTKGLVDLGDDFVRENVAAAAVCAVYDFCGRPTFARIAPSELRQRQVQRYLDKVMSRSVTSVATQCRDGLVSFLEWLRDRGLLSFDPGRLRKRPPAVLPKSATDFLEALAPTHRPGTCHGYRCTLNHFHRWLRVRRFGLRDLSRKQVVGWFYDLHRRGLHPSTRLSHLIQLRVYFRWLAERALLAADPYDLVRTTDYPKLPDYLPRPFPPDFDRELQRRLAASSDKLHRALLLMRLTGMRVGELVSLPYDCIRTDVSRRSFLVVPIGKLYNERIVPLNAKVVDLVRWIQARGRRPRTWLLAAPDERAQCMGELRQGLRAMAHDLDAGGPVVTHRLRHTYATSLLTGGMSLLGVMRLLGHRDFRMTLRYTAITDETVGKEYRAALAELEKKYATQIAPASPTDDDPVALLAHVAGSLRRLVEAPASVRALLKRIDRLRADIERLRLKLVPAR